MGLIKFVIMITLAIVMANGALFISSHSGINSIYIFLAGGLLLLYGIDFIDKHYICELVEGE